MKRNVYILGSFTGECKKLFNRIHKNKKDKLSNRKKLKEELKNYDR
jgi:hypothetical protein